MLRGLLQFGVSPLNIEQLQPPKDLVKFGKNSRLFYLVSRAGLT